MSTVQRIAKNTSLLFAGDVVSSLLGLLLVVYIARHLGDVGFGKYSFVLAFTLLFSFIADLGLYYFSIREIARNRRLAGEYLTNISLIKAVLSVVTITLIVVIINLMDYPQDITTAVYIAGATVVFTSFTHFFWSIFRAFERMEFEAITKIAERVLVIGVALTVLLQGYGLVELLSAILGAHILATLLTFTIVVRKFARPKLAFDLALCKRMLKTSLPFALAVVSSVFYTRIDTVMLSIWKGDAVVGWYNAAYQLIWGLQFIPMAFTGSVYPILSKYFASSENSLRLAYEKSFKLLTVLAIPLGIGITLLAPEIIHVLYGEAFTPSVTALQILIWVGCPTFVTMIVGYTLFSMDKQIVDMKFTGIGALMNVVLNLLLIPRFSYIGAGVASVVCRLFVLGFEFNYLQRNLHKINLFRMLWKPSLAAVIMGVMIYGSSMVIDGSVVGLVAIIIGAIIAYAMLLYLFKVFDENELKLFKSAFAWRR